MTSGTEVMTRTDRDTLIKIARQRERVAKSEAKERSAHLMADFETQMDRHYRFDENEVWEKAATALDDALKNAKKEIDQECERLGIPEQFRPTVSAGWYGKGRNATKDQRAEMRRIALRQVEAAEKSARAAIERQSLQVQESIMVSGLTTEGAKAMLESMPTVDSLMPSIGIQDVQALIADRRECRHDF